MSKIKDWFIERIPLDLEPLKTFGSMPVPDHLRHWWWALGGTPAYLFIVQIITGVLLTFYYIPHVDHAYESVKNINEVVTYGWYIRSLHHWSASFMIIAVILHVTRVFFTGAYRKPRELNWMLGVMMLATTLIIGFTGYSLIFEQLSYWGITVVANLLEAIPFIGQIVADFFRGGTEVTQVTLSRVFIFHVAILPALLIVFVIIHFLIMHGHGITEYQFPEEKKKPRKTFPFVPDHLVNEIILALILMLFMTVLAIVFPVGLEEKANPLVTPPHIKPEWYFYFAFRILKLTSLTMAVLITGGCFFIMLVWPFIDRLFRRKNPNSEISIIIGILGVLMLVGLTVWEAIVLFNSH